jgi:hypothetical protein
VLDHEGNTLVPARGFDTSIKKYVAFLDAGVREFKISSAPLSGLKQETTLTKN